MSSTCNCVEIACIKRSRQGEVWVTERGDAFLDPPVLSTHFIADLIHDNMKIYKYKIQWFNGGWSGWYFPGSNDNEWTAKGDSDDVWNQAHKDAGRRSWTLFADHNHEVCYLKNEITVQSKTKCDCGDAVKISCIPRSKQGEVWVTARGDAFLDPPVLSTHFIADIIHDNKKIYKYKIQWFNTKWSGWYFPGSNDNEWTAKGDSDNVWNQAHKDAGRRSWTLFADHNHEVCYLMDGTAIVQISQESSNKASIQKGVNELDTKGVNGVSLRFYQEARFGYILVVGVILFILINNVFIGYWFVCKRDKINPNVEYEKCEIVNVDDE